MDLTKISPLKKKKNYLTEVRGIHSSSKNSAEDASQSPNAKAIHTISRFSSSPDPTKKTLKATNQLK